MQLLHVKSCSFFQDLTITAVLGKAFPEKKKRKKKSLPLIHLISSTETKQKDQLQPCCRSLLACPHLPSSAPLWSLCRRRYFWKCWGNVVIPLNKAVRSSEDCVHSSFPTHCEDFCINFIPFRDGLCRPAAKHSLNVSALKGHII